LGYPVARGIVRDARADEVIKRKAKRLGHGAVVVTSDREVAHFVETVGATAVSSEEFEGRMDMAVVMEERAMDQEEVGRGGSGKGDKEERASQEAFQEQETCDSAIKEVVILFGQSQILKRIQGVKGTRDQGFKDPRIQVFIF